MAKPNAPPPAGIPKGILVSATGNARKVEPVSPWADLPVATAILVPDVKVREPDRPAPVRRVSTRGQLPWVPIIAGGSALWTAIIVGMAVFALATERTQERMRAPEVKLLAVVQPGQAQVKAAPVVPPQVVEPMEEVEVKAKAPAPKLPFREPAIPKLADMPPPIKIVPDELRRLAPEGPLDEPAPAKKLGGFQGFANCANIGTNILFHKDPVEAFERARAEKKMVFMVHLSGDLEDKDFT